MDLLAPIPAPIPVSRLIDQNEPEVKKARYDGEENRLVLYEINSQDLKIHYVQYIGIEITK